jgi:hypothetical protein
MYGAWRGQVVMNGGVCGGGEYMYVCMCVHPSSHACTHTLYIYM